MAIIGKHLLYSSVVVSIYRDQKSWGGIDRLKLAIDGWNRQPLDRFEIIFADDGSPDSLSETLPVLKRFRGRWSYYYLHPQSKEFRLAAARNLGISKSAGAQYISTDEDCVPCKNFIEKHQAAFVRDAILVGSTVRIKEAELSALEALPEYDKLESMAYVTDQRIDHQTRVLKQQLDPRFVWGGNFSVPMDLVKSAGGYNDDIIGWGGEDVTLAYRLVEHQGLQIKWTDAFLYHLDHPSRTEYESKWPEGKQGLPFLANGKPLPHTPHRRKWDRALLNIRSIFFKH